MAKLRYDQLLNAIKRPLKPVYLITGDEPLQVQEACDAIRIRARQLDYTERELYHTDSGFDWVTLYHASNSLSLFADKKIIEIRVHNGKIDAKAGKALLEYCQAADDNTLLLLVLPKIDKRTQNSEWFKAIANKGDIVSIWPISPQALPKWLDQRLHAAGLNASSEAIELLTAKVEGNLLAAVQEIEKLKLLTNDQTVIDATAMAQAVISSARYDVFGLVDKALAHQPQDATRCLQGLREEGTEAPVVLWALANEVRKLTAIKEALDQGQNFDSAARANGVWDNRKRLVGQALNRLSITTLYQQLTKIALADKTIKGAATGDAWAILLDITLSLAGVEVFQKHVI